MKLLNMAAKKTAKQMRAQVKKDVTAANKQLKIPGQDHYHDLATKDSGVSPSWIDGLIARSKTPDQLEKVRGYLLDRVKSRNIDHITNGSLLSKVADRIEALEQQAFIKKLMENRKAVEKLIDMLNDIL